MSKPSIPSLWPIKQDVPIYLNASNEREHICHTCKTSSRNQPIHCIMMASATSSSYSSNPPPVTTSRNLTVPGLKLQTPRSWSRPQPPLPTLRFDIRSDVAERPHIRSRRSNFSPLSSRTIIGSDIHHGWRGYSSGSSIPNTPDDDVEYKRSKLGLGISEAPLNPNSNPTRSPGGENLAKAEQGQFSNKKRSPEIIERKLWKCETSRNVFKRWLFEFISWSLSALCMGAIIIVLFMLKDRPLPKDQPTNLTLNAYIAILSKISSASLLFPASEALGQLKWNWFQGGESKNMWDFEIFDNASRGPWGAFLLLVRTKGRTLAALGSTITIFIMALDPFFQQVVRYPQRWELQEQNSSIPRLISYETPFVQEFREEDVSINADQDIRPVVTKHFLDFGIPQIQVGNGTGAEIPLTCTASNCTWEPYETLGVCSECADVADKLDFACLAGNLDWVQNATIYAPPKNGTMCGWFFNATSVKPVLMLGYQADSITNRPNGEILMTRTIPLVTNVLRRPLFGGSINFKHIRNPITDFVVVSAADGPDRERIVNSIFRHEKPRALECMLSWCVQTIKSSYHLAIYTEITKDIFFNTTAGPWPWVKFEVDDPEIGNAVMNRYFQDIVIDPHVGDAQRENTSYRVSNDTAFSVLAVFDDYLPSYTTTKVNISETSLRYRVYQKKPFQRGNVKNPWAAPNNMTHHVERLAASITNTMRQSSKDMAEGKAFSEKIYVEVHWLWLSLPIGLLVLTLIFLIATVVRTSKDVDQVGVWKNSSIATLLYGLPDEMRWKINSSQEDSTPRTRAKEFKVRMASTKGWRISGVPVQARESPRLNRHHVGYD